MPRVLHLIDAASRQACPTTLALIALTARATPDAEVLLLGGSALDDHAAAAGLDRFRRVNVPGGRGLLGAPAARRALAGRRFDLIHCWSVGAGLVAGLTRPRTPRLLSLVQPPHGDSLVWLRRATRGGRLTVTTLDASLRQRIVDAGADPAAVHVLEPGLDPAPLTQADREAVRAAWGLDDPAARAVALLSDPPRAGDARRASLALGLANESLTVALGQQPQIRLFMHPGQHRRASAWQMLLSYGVGEIVGQDARVAAPWRVLPACDGVLLLGEHGNGLALRWAMAAGVPVVAERTAGVEDLLENGVSGLIVEPDQPKRLAHRLHQLLVDPASSRRRGESAQAKALDRFDPDSYLARTGRLYERLLAHASVGPLAA